MPFIPSTLGPPSARGWLPALALPAALLLAAAAPARLAPSTMPGDPGIEQSLSPESGTEPLPAPLPPPGEMARCKALIDAGLPAAARARLAPIVEQHPEWARALGLLALTYYKENRFEPARELFARALAADPAEIAVRPFYGWTLYSLGELDAAAAMFASLLERLPDYAPAHYALGVIDLDRDRLDAARRHLEAAARLAREQEDAPMEGRTRARLGDLHARLDELPEAKAELERALELFPGEHEALFRLSRVLLRLGDKGGAEAARRRYEEARAANAATAGGPEGTVAPGGPSR